MMCPNHAKQLINQGLMTLIKVNSSVFSRNLLTFFDSMGLIIE
jgi:hypothetical protein